MTGGLDPGQWIIGTVLLLASVLLGVWQWRHRIETRSDYPCGREW